MNEARETQLERLERERRRLESERRDATAESMSRADSRIWGADNDRGASTPSASPSTSRNCSGGGSDAMSRLRVSARPRVDGRRGMSRMPGVPRHLGRCRAVPEARRRSRATGGGARAADGPRPRRENHSDHARVDAAVSALPGHDEPLRVRWRLGRARRCLPRHGIWFDHDELRRIIQFIQSPRGSESRRPGDQNAPPRRSDDDSGMWTWWDLIDFAVDIFIYW